MRLSQKYFSDHFVMLNGVKHLVSGGSGFFVTLRNNVRQSEAEPMTKRVTL